MKTQDRCAKCGCSSVVFATLARPCIRRVMPMSSRRRHWCHVPAVVLGLAFGLDTLAAQCGHSWQQGRGVPGLSSSGLFGGLADVTALWDPDGPGPMSSQVVVAGEFSCAGDIAANNIASWDPATGSWSPFGAGFSGPIFRISSLAPLPNGDIAVAYSSLPYVNVWNGTSWVPLGSLPRTPGVLAALPNGDLVATCPQYFPHPLWPQLSYYEDELLRWTGSAWAPIAPRTRGVIEELVGLANGDVFVGGSISLAGSTPVSGIARWDGASWQTLGAGIGGRVDGLAVTPSGDLIAVGPFTTAGGSPANQVAKWNGTTWAPLGAGVNGAWRVTTTPNGDVWVGGSSAGAVLLARWDGAAWSSPPSTPTAGFGAANVWSMTGMPNGDVFVGGSFHAVAGVPVLGVTVWDGSGWQALGFGLATRVEAMTTLPGGEVVTGGFWADGLMQWAGTSWSRTGPPGSTTCFAALPNGDVLAGGNYSVSASNDASVLRWNGTAWSPLGTPVSLPTAIAALPNGDVVIGLDNVYSGLRYWDGASWSLLGGTVAGRVYALSRLANGDLIAGGDFTTAGGVPAQSIARWNGTAWSALGGGYSGAVRAVLQLQNGDLVVTGQPSWSGSTVHRWDGNTWTPLGSSANGTVFALLELPNGDILAGGSFTSIDGQAAANVARWDGASWSEFAGGTDGAVKALAMRADGELFVGGYFHHVGGVLSAHAARARSGCPAIAANIVTACTGRSGPLALEATALAWIGATYRLKATGFAGNALAASVVGFSLPGIPLSAIHPAALPNCHLYASSDFVRLATPMGGMVLDSIVVPEVPALIGVRFFQQFLQAEFGTGGAFALSSSNGLDVTVGAF